MNLELSINQIFKLINVNGADKTYIIEGPMGSGKSSITSMFDAVKYNVVTVDCTQWDVGDVQIPSVDKERRIVEFLPNVLLVGNRSKPMVILLDEIGKASRPVQNSRTDSTVRVPTPSRSRTHAMSSSPYRASGTPTTCTSSTSGCVSRNSSTSRG